MAIVLCLYIAKCQKYLHISKKFCTFAPEIGTRFQVLIYMYNTKFCKGNSPNLKKNTTFGEKVNRFLAYFKKIL